MGERVIARVEVACESPADQAGIRRVHTLAFSGPAEADLVDALRAAARPILSLVAREGSEPVGHILFSPAVVEEESGTIRAAGVVALGPMAVLPARQRRGIGSALVAAGLAACRARGDRVVFVVGHPGFYPRFGFVPASPLGLRCEFPVPEEVFMVNALTPGCLDGCRGLVRYHPLFHTAA